MNLCTIDGSTGLSLATFCVFDITDIVSKSHTQVEPLPRTTANADLKKTRKLVQAELLRNVRVYRMTGVIVAVAGCRSRAGFDFESESCSIQPLHAKPSRKK